MPLRPGRCPLILTALALTLGLALAALLSGGAAAMSNAKTVAPPPWIALVVSNDGPSGGPGPTGCTGTVVGSGWVLTAAHCVYDDDDRRVAASKISVELNRRNFNDPGDRGAVSHRVGRVAVMPGYPAMNANDAALLQLVGFDAARWNAVPLARERPVVNEASGVTLFGYGDYRWRTATESEGEAVLRKSPQGAFRRQPSCDNGFICIRAPGATKAMTGDSGGPFLRWVSGAWQIIGVAAEVDDRRRDGAQDPVRAVGALSARPPSKVLIDWVRSVAGLPVPPAGTIVRNRSNGASWLVTGDGYRNWIPTGGDWLCLVGRGAPVRNLDQVMIDSIPDRVGTHARCSPPPTQPAQPTAPAQPAQPTVPPVTPLRRVIVVDNRVTNGAGMREDPTPVRLTTQPWTFCSSRGCNIGGTDRVSGQSYDAAVCQRAGERTTNGNDSSPADDANPRRFESTRYYGVRLSNGTFGYVSEVWIRADFRGGLGLPGC